MDIKKQHVYWIVSYILVIFGFYITYHLFSQFYTFFFWHLVDVWGYSIPYQEYTAMIITKTSFIILFFLFIFITIIKSFKVKLFLWIIWLLIWIFSNILWYIINPMYIFDEHPKLFWYMDSKWEYIIKVDKYIELVDKYWCKYSDNFRPPKTLEEHIKLIDFAIKWNYETLWRLAFQSAWNIYWYDELFKNYHDKTTETEYLTHVFMYNRENEDNWLYDNYKWFYYLKDYWSTELIRKVAWEMYNWYENNKGKEEIDFFHSDENWKDNIKNKYYYELTEYKWLNLRMIETWKYQKDKFLLDENWDYYIVENYYMKQEQDKINWD